MQEKMTQLMELASKGEYNVFDPKLGRFKTSTRDTEKE
jgi:hypothetical protein